MRRIAWIGHYIEESDIFHLNNFKHKSEIIRKLFLKINKHFSPYVFTSFKNTAKDIEFYGIICPLLPSAVAALGKSRQLHIMKQAIKLANSIKADQIVIAALFASIWENGDELKALTRAPITTGKNLIASITIDNISRAGNLLKKELTGCTIGIIGYKNRIAKIFTEHFLDKVNSILVDSEDDKIKESGKIKKVSNEELFKNSDIIIVTTMGVGLAAYTGLIKPGTIICDIVVPYYLTKEIRKKRGDIFAFEGVWSRYKDLSAFAGRDLNRLFPNGVMPACAAEPIILAMENMFGEFSLSDNINYRNMCLMNERRLKNGFEFFGFKKGQSIYSKQEQDLLINIKTAKRNDGCTVKR